MTNITAIHAAIAAGNTVRIPSDLLDDEHCLDSSLCLREASQDHAEWWSHIEGNGYTLGVWQDDDGAYWVVEYDPAGDAGEPLKLVFAGNSEGDVSQYLGVEATE